MKAWSRTFGFRPALLRHGAGHETDADLKMAFHDLRELKVDVAYPFLLELYNDYKTDALSKADCWRACDSSRRMYSGVRSPPFRRTR